MDEITIARQAFKDYVRSRIDIPKEFKNTILAHERVPLFIDQLAKELKLIPGLTRDTIVKVSQDMSQLFINCAMHKRQTDMLSSVSRQLEIQKRREQIKFVKQAEQLDEKGADYVFSERGEYEAEEATSKADQVQTGILPADR